MLRAEQREILEAYFRLLLVGEALNYCDGKLKFIVNNALWLKQH
jgi:hypothetical protein